MHDLPVALSFLGVQEEFSKARVAVLPVPYDLTTTYQPGARFGPRALLTASLNVELLDEEMGWDPSTVGIHTLEPLVPVASGPQAMVPAIADQIERILRAGKFPVTIGGDHSVTIGALRAFGSAWEGLWVLQLDAHADLRDQYQGSPFSHACVMARARESFECVQVALRSWSEEEAPLIERFRHQILTAASIHESPQAVTRWLEGALGDPVYVTIDVDCLDPSVMPATGTPEPGGLSWWDVLSILRWVGSHRRVVGLDLTELSPIPGLVAPDFLAARLLYKAIGYALRGKNPGA